MKQLRIALLIESSRAYGRELLRGIAAYAREHGRWSFYHQERAVGDPAPARLSDWHADAVIARIETPGHIRQIRRLGVPVVDVFGMHRLPGVPSVEVNQEKIARLAADHLRERNLPRYAYCGFPGVFFSDARSRHFTHYLSKEGGEVHVYRAPRHRVGAHLSAVEMRAIRQIGHLAGWLQSLPKPIGLMACNDMRALQVLGVCREQGIAVPEEVAVVGVDDDSVQCELCDPPLSSVDPSARRVGYEAAAMLERMLEGRPPRKSPLLVDPAGIVARQSTAVLPTSDPWVVGALQFIHDHFSEPIGTADVLRRVGVSRSTLERRFLTALGRTPTAELARVRLECVKELLRCTDLSLRHIADRAGFDHVETMCRFFKRRTAQTPGTYRRQ